MSQLILNVMLNVDDHSSHYRFLYQDLQRILRDSKSTGNTSVRFVSKALRFRNDTQFRHVSLEFTESKKTHVSEIYSNITVNSDWKDEFALALPNIDLSITDVLETEEGCKSMYLLGLHDCRHHVSDMFKLCYPLEKKT